MRKVIFAMLVAAGFGLTGIGGASAAPASGASISDALNVRGMIEQVQYYRYRGPRCRSVRVCRGYGYNRRCWWERRCW